jgi:hypothetical protein
MAWSGWSLDGSWAPPPVRVALVNAHGWDRDCSALCRRPWPLQTAPLRRLASYGPFLLILALPVLMRGLSALISTKKLSLLTAWITQALLVLCNLPAEVQGRKPVSLNFKLRQSLQRAEPPGLRG